MGGKSFTPDGRVVFFFALSAAFFLASAPAVRAQEAPAAALPAQSGEAVNDADIGEAGAAAAEKPPELSEEEKGDRKERADFERRVELDIKTATLAELAEWSRELGLGEGGSRDELASRIRSHYKMSALDTSKDYSRVITIESARTTEYFKVESVDEEYARLSGGVVISLKDGDALHKIEAWEILYNRTRNVVSATGGVKYRREEGGNVESFSGESIIINLDTWVGSFIDTVSERSIANAETAYRFAGQVISKTDSATTVLKNARVTNAKSEEPYWSLSATRIWLFPGSDWAFFNATLKVGEVPVFYLPFFVYPADEVVFHPVLGSRTRQGYFAQTTTYLWGRAAANPNDSSSISKILGSGDGTEKKREGLFLRSTGKPETSGDGKKFAFLLDAYSNLGFYTGWELELPNLAFINSFHFSGGLGWTRTLFYYSDYNFYSPYNLFLTDKLESEWNHSYLFGFEVPFRYRFNIETSASGRLGSLDLKFPMYSDPFIDNDTVNYRSEHLDIMRLATAGTLEDLDASSMSNIGSYQWSLTMRPKISITKLSPWISNISVSSISTFLSFITRDDKSKGIYAPERQFFAPDKYTLYSISTAISGSPFSQGAVRTLEQKKDAADPAAPVKDVGTPIAPWQKSEDAEAAAKAAPVDEMRLSPPALAQMWTLPRSNSLRFSMNYNFNPASATEMQYFNTHFSGLQDIDLSDIKSTLSNFRTDGSTSFSITEAGNNIFNTTFGFSGSFLWQDHVYINDELSDVDKRSLLLADYRGKQWTVNSNYNFTLNPFYWSPTWRTTNFQHSMSALVARSLFDEQKYNNDRLGMPANYEPTPEWKLSTIEWTRDYISSHRLTANVGMNIMDNAQNLSVSMELPPRYQLYSANATMRAWRLESSANMQIQEDTDENKEAAKKTPWIKKYHYVDGYLFRPLYITETLNIASGKSGRFYAVWDPELYEWTNMAANFYWGTLSAGYTAVYMYKYYYKQGQGWKQETSSSSQENPSAGGEQKLYPRDISLSWNPGHKFEPMFHNLISLSTSMRSSILLDLQRYSYSKFTFSLTLGVGITKFLDFSISANSENAEIYRYMQELPLFEPLDVPGGKIGQGKENNFLLDLINSFRFDKEELRRNSGYKLRSFSFSAVHHLGDWDATLNVSMSPYLDQTASNPQDWSYKFRTTFSFFVQWLPISEIEAGVDYQNDKFIKREKAK